MIVILIVLLMSFLVFFGLWTNFITIFPFNFATLLIDLSFICLIITTIHIWLFRKIKPKLHRIQIIYLALFLFSILIFVFNTNMFKERILGFRNISVYSSLIFTVPILISSKKAIEYLLNIWFVFGFIISVFAIIQGLFFDFLPQSLQVLKEETAFSFYGTDLIRINGLMGNTIVFTGFCIMYFFLSFTFFHETRKKKYLLYGIVSVITIFLTYSRIAYIAPFILLFLQPILQISLKNIIKWCCYILIFFLVIYLINYSLDGYIVASIKETFIFSRLTGDDISTQGSDDDHLFITLAAISAIIQNPLTGVGLGSQGESSGAGLGSNAITTDGSWFQLFLELGIPLSILFLFLMFSILKLLISLSRNSTIPLVKGLSNGLIGYIIFVLPAGFLDSIFTYRITYILFWFFVGCIISYINIEYRNHEQRDHTII